MISVSDLGHPACSTDLPTFQSRVDNNIKVDLTCREISAGVKPHTVHVYAHSVSICEHEFLNNWVYRPILAKFLHNTLGNKSACGRPLGLTRADIGLLCYVTCYSYIRPLKWYILKIFIISMLYLSHGSLA